VNPVTGRLYIADGTYRRVLSWPNGAAYVNGQEADLVLGAPSPFDPPPISSAITPSQRTLDYPVSLAVDGVGNLWVADVLNNRVLRFDAPQTNGMAASVVLGQPGFTTKDAMAGDRGMWTPTGLALDSAGRLAVADDFNSRVLIFDPPFSTGQAASVVLGQPDFITTTSGISERKLSHPGGVAFDRDRRLFVTDRSNHRVLGFSFPQATNEAATLVIGQPNFLGGSFGTTATTLRAPYTLQLDANGYLFVSDTGNNRVLVYKPAYANGMAASFVLGQPDFATSTVTRTRSSTYNPLGLALDDARNLYVADEFNGRVIRFDTPIATPAPVLMSVSPATLPAGSPGAVLTVKGSDFVLTSKALWNGAERPTTFIDPSTLQVTIPASDLASVGTVNVSVQSPGPGGGTTTALPVTIVQPVFTVMAPAALVQAQIQ
jgi:sugar lactone lactonase YvrE